MTYPLDTRSIRFPAAPAARTARQTLDAVCRPDTTSLKPIQLSVSADGVMEEGEYLFGTASVDHHIAGLYTLPEELIGPADGRVAAVLIKAPKSVADWDLLGRSFLSGDPNCSMVKVLTGRELLVTSSEPIEWSLDGESSGLQTQVRISTKAGFLTLQG